jgi:hypothetical protein
MDMFQYFLVSAYPASCKTQKVGLTMSLRDAWWTSVSSASAPPMCPKQMRYIFNRSAANRTDTCKKYDLRDAEAKAVRQQILDREHWFQKELGRRD